MEGLVLGKLFVLNVFNLTTELVNTFLRKFLNFLVCYELSELLAKSPIKFVVDSGKSY